MSEQEQEQEQQPFGLMASEDSQGMGEEMDTETESEDQQPRRLLSVETAKEVTKREEQEISDASVSKPDIQSSLLLYVKDCFSQAENERTTRNIDELLLDALRRRKGEYPPDVLAKYKAQGNSSIWVPLTEQKCNAAEAWMSDVLMPYGDRIWTIEPTPLPELQPHVLEELAKEVAAVAQRQQMLTPDFVPDEQWARDQAEILRAKLKEELRDEAREKAAAMTQRIDDQLEESNWFGVFKDFQSNVVTFGTGFLKGPVVRPVKQLTWDGDDPKVVVENRPCVEAPSPQDIYPSPRATETTDGYIIERSFTSRSSIAELRDLPYYQAKEIDRLLSAQPKGIMQQRYGDAERASLERKPDPVMNTDREVELFEFWGPVPGHLLKSWGVPEADDKEEYEFQVIWAGEHVLKVMPNPDPLKRRPYHKAVFKRTVQSFWGKGVPHLMKSSQDRANASMRALVDNMGLCSGPQIVVDVSRLPAGERVTHIYPRKVWMTTNENNLTTKPVEFFQPSSNVGELMAMYRQAATDADLESGVPAYNYGSDQISGAGRTTSGLSMLMNASARGIKESFANIDRTGIGPLIERFYIWNMLYTDDDSIKGDLQVVTKGATGMLLREITLSKTTELLNRTANPTDMQIIGMDGRAKLLRKSIELLNIDAGDIMPSEDELEQKEQQAEQMRLMQMATERAKMAAGQTPGPEAMMPGAPPPDQGPGANNLGTQPNMENETIPQMLG